MFEMPSEDVAVVCEDVEICVVGERVVTCRDAAIVCEDVEISVGEERVDTRNEVALDCGDVGVNGVVERVSDCKDATNDCDDVETSAVEERAVTCNDVANECERSVVDWMEPALTLGKWFVMIGFGAPAGHHLSTEGRAPAGHQRTQACMP